MEHLFCRGTQNKIQPGCLYDQDKKSFHKLEMKQLEDFRIDFEMVSGTAPTIEEDATAVNAAKIWPLV